MSSGGQAVGPEYDSTRSIKSFSQQKYPSTDFSFPFARRVMRLSDGSRPGQYSSRFGCLLTTTKEDSPLITSSTQKSCGFDQNDTNEVCRSVVAFSAGGTLVARVDVDVNSLSEWTPLCRTEKTQTRCSPTSRPYYNLLLSHGNLWNGSKGEI
jgi:hypothetical protein